VNDVIWITGASSGIGRALALELAGRGASVAASARRTDELERLAADAATLPAASGGKAGAIRAFPVDVTDTAAMAATVARIEAEFGPIATAVMNAGLYLPMSGAELDTAKFATTLAVNVMGVVNGIAPVTAAMKARKRGRIAIVSSVAGYSGLPTSAAYGASKAALINLAESLKFDLDPLGIRVQLISPGFVETPATDVNPFPMPFLMKVETAAARIADGLAGDAFEVTFPRRFTYGLKLARILPYWAYFPLARRAMGIKA
jgi:NAD(P)-dependent dehydrogenase (short-subunit alcohol dehydrogenase family)